jgi:hypothetical protein
LNQTKPNHCDTQADVTDEEAKHPQIDKAEMKNVNTKCKTNKNTQSSGVMASMLFLSVVDRGSRSGRVKPNTMKFIGFI